MATAHSTSVSTLSMLWRCCTTTFHTLGSSSASSSAYGLCEPVTTTLSIRISTIDLKWICTILWYTRQYAYHQFVAPCASLADNTCLEMSDRLYSPGYALATLFGCARGEDTVVKMSVSAIASNCSWMLGIIPWSSPVCLVMHMAKTMKLYFVFFIGTWKCVFL